MSCFNFETESAKKEFVRLSKFLPIPTQIQRVMQALDGNTEHITSKTHLIEVIKEINYKDLEKQVEQLKEPLVDKPLSRFTPEQKEELIDNLIFLASWDSNNQNIKSIDNINFTNVKSDLEKLKNRAGGIYAKNYEEALKDDNYALLEELAIAKLNSLDIDVDTEENPEDKNEGGKEFEDSFLIENNKKARAFIRLLTSTIPTKEPGKVLGIYKFLPSVDTFKTLEDTLTNLHIGRGEDAYQKMMDKIIKDLSHKPELLKLKEFLDKGPAHHRVQFVRAFSTYDITYSSSVINTKNAKKGIGTKYIDSNSSTPVTTVLSIWENAYLKSFITKQKNKPVITEKSKKNIKNIIDRYEVVKKEINKKVKDNETDYSPEDLDTALKVLKTFGVEMSRPALVLYLNNTEGTDLEALKYLYSNVIDKFIYSSKKSKNTLSDFIKDKVTLNDDGIAISPITNESAIKELAIMQEKFDPTITSQGFLGADGKIYQTKSEFDYVAKVITDLKNGDDYINDISSEYTTFSPFIEQLKDPAVKEELDILYFNSRREEGGNSVTMKDISEVDEFSERIDRVVSKNLLPYFTLADKNRVYFVKGLKALNTKTTQGKPTTEMVDTLLEAFANELLTMRKASKEILTTPIEKQIEGYHYKKLDKDGNPTGLGNAFTSTIFPQLNPGTELAKEFGLYEEGTNTPFQLSSTFIDESLDAEGNLVSATVNSGFFSNKDLRNYARAALKNRANKLADKMMEELVTFENGNLTNIALSQELFNTYISPNITKVDNPTLEEIRKGVEAIALNYTYMTTVANLEWSRLFTGDPRKYKNLEDFIKRTPATSATGSYLYIGEEGASENFKIAIAPNIIEKSKELTSNESKKLILEWAGDYLTKEELDTLTKPYEKVNRTDAQGWMLPERFRDILKGLGDWNSEVMDPAFDRMLKGEETEEDIKIFSKKLSTMQPKKGMYFQNKKDEFGEVTPIYLKYSTAVLFPGLVKNSPQLAKIAKAMRTNEISEIIVGDGVKAGKIKATDLNADNIEFNSITLSNRYWKLQQDLPAKDKETTVGSQIQKNIIGDIVLEADYGNNRTGEDVLKETHQITSELSNRGFQKVLKKLGLNSNDISYNKETKEWEIDSNASLDGLYDLLIEEFINDGETGDVIQALKERTPIEFIISHRDQLMSKVTSIFTKEAIQLKQPGGANIQMSNYGFEFGDDRKKATEVSELPQSIASDIVWLQEDNHLKAPSVIEKDGEIVFQRGQVLMPYNMLARVFGKEWENVKKLPTNEIVKLIDPKALQIIGYRIPNQKLASNDSLEIAGILPPSAGNTIIAYSAITTKTGSDFDIDKMYYTMRPIRLNKKTGRVEAVQYLDEKNSTLEERYEAYKNKQLQTKEVKDYLEKEGFKISDIKKLIREFGKNSLTKKLLDANFSFILSEDEALEEIDAILIEDKIISSIEEFNNLPISEQNTLQALQSKRIDLYDEILTHPSSYSRLISTVDPEWLSYNMKAMQDITKLEALEFYGGEYQTAVRRINSSAKAGVGQTANMLTDHAISQWANKYIKQFENKIGDKGHLTENNDIDLSRQYTKAFENIVALDKKGNVISSDDIGTIEVASFKLDKVIENNYHISEVISAYMNAFVDAAKDNYIGEANFNTMTNNTAFLLLRNGVSPQFVNAFLAQPIIKEFVKETNKKEGQAVPLSTTKPVELVLEKFGGSKINNEVSLSNFDTVDLMNNILKYNKGEEISLSEQRDLLGLFLHFREVSKHLRDSVVATKSDTGIGKSLFDAYITVNKKKSVDKKGVVGNWNQMFYKDGIETMAGAFYKNGPQAAMSIIGKKTLLGTDAVYRGLQYMYKKIWGELPNDAGRVKKLYNLTIASVLANKTNFNISFEKLNELNKGENSIVNQVIALQENEKYSGNLLLENLESENSYTGEVSYVGINNAKPRNSKINDRIRDDWEELYLNSETKEFAKDLAIYAFYTSALQDGLGTLHRLIPNSLRRDMGLNIETFNSLRGALNNLGEDGVNSLVEGSLDQILRNSWSDTKLVPRISKRNRLPIAGVTQDTHFGISSSNKSIVIGKDIDGNAVYKPYIRFTYTSEDPTSRFTQERLYKYIGNSVSKDGEDIGVYERVGLLGNTRGKFKLYEFTTGRINKSIISSNNISPELKNKIDNNHNKISITQPGDINLKTEEIIGIDLEISEKISNIEDSVDETAEVLKNLDNGCKNKK